MRIKRASSMLHFFMSDVFSSLCYKSINFKTRVCMFLKPGSVGILPSMIDYSLILYEHVAPMSSSNVLCYSDLNIEEVFVTY